MIPADVHPGPNAGIGTLEPRRTTYKPGDNRVELRRCAQCGFLNRVGIEAVSDSYDSEGIKQVQLPVANALGDELTQYLTNPSFDLWSSGTSFSITLNGGTIAIADNWTNLSSGGSGDTCIISRESGIVLDGPYSLKCQILTHPTLSNLSVNATFTNAAILALPVGTAITLKARLLGQACGPSIGNVTLGETQFGGNVITAAPVFKGNGTWETLLVSIKISAGNTGIVATIFLPTSGTSYLDKVQLFQNLVLSDPQQVAGCRFCGSLNSVGRNRNWRDYGTGVDMSNK